MISGNRTIKVTGPIEHQYQAASNGFIYQLKDAGFYKGKEMFKNRVTIQISYDKSVVAEEKDIIAKTIINALNALLPQ